jgi:uncharacterized protein (TIGR02452 family)
VGLPAGQPDVRLARQPAGRFYSDYVLYSPDVPVFRTGDGTLLEEPWPCAVLTSPAVFADAVRRYAPVQLPEIPDAMFGRIRKVLAVAERHGHDTLVLGAWGCGAFGNDVNAIAPLFRRALEEHFAGAFQLVVFAITHWSGESRNIAAFREAFGGGSIELVR